MQRSRRALLIVLGLAVGIGTLRAQVMPSSSSAGASVAAVNTWTALQTYRDNAWEITDDIDTTKIGTFQLSGVTTGITRTLTWPDANGTLALLSLAQTWTANQTLALGNQAEFGGQLFIGTRAGETPDAAFIASGTASNSVLVVEAGDVDFDHAHPLQANPTFFFHSAAQSTTQWLSLTHNGVDPVIAAGAGTTSFAGTTPATIGKIKFGTSATGVYTIEGNATAGTGTFDTGFEAATDIWQFQENGVDRFVIGGSGVGANVAGINTFLSGGRGTGTGLPGIVGAKYPLLTSAGSTLQTLSTTTYSVPTVAFTATADAAVTNTVTETTILGTGVGTKTVEAGLLVPGRTIRITVRGFITNTGTPTLNIQVKAGTTVLESTGVQTMSTITGTEGFEVSAIVTCRTMGATGIVYTQGQFHYDTSVTGFAVEDMSASATVTLDTTVAQTLDVTATWGTAAAANSITGTDVIIEYLN